MHIAQMLAAGAALLGALGCGGGQNATAPAAVTRMATARTKAVLEHHLSAVRDRDLDEIAKDYTRNSVLLTPYNAALILPADGVSIGSGTIRRVFAGGFSEFARPGSSFSLVKQFVEGETAYLVWRAATADHTIELGATTYVIRDGKIAYQTAVGTVTPELQRRANYPYLPQPESPTRTMVEHYIKSFREHNVKETLASYAGNAVLVSPKETVRGTAVLRQYFTRRCAQLAAPGVKFTLLSLRVSGEIAQLAWAVGTAGDGVELGADTLLIRDGKIVFHTTTAR